ncbi:MAG: 6-bladed beta-propeller [Gemmatimonadota bacterium]|nr:6-bladed beta-propeller [Gemmatimonadota bacterium]
MTPGTLVTTGIALLTATLPALTLSAQEVIDLPGRDQRLDADFEEVFRIGALDGEDWEMLATVMHVAFDEKGNLYVVDGSGGMSFGGGTRVLGLGSDGLRILVFDQSGNFLREFGTSGEGPGEFNMPAGFAVLRDGTTIVSDNGHRAYQLFDADGRFLRMVRGSEGAGPGGVSSNLLPDPRGNAVFTGEFGRSILVMNPGGGGAAPPTSRPITRLALDGDAVDTDTVVDAWLPRREPAELKLPAGIQIAVEGDARAANALSGLSQPSVYEPFLMAGVLPDGSLVHSDSSAYELKITPPDAADAARVIRRPIRPEPVTPRIEKAYLEAREAARREGGGASGAFMMMRSVGTGGGNPSGGSDQTFTLEMPEPTFYPELSVLRDLSTTWDGSIWVRRRGDEPESDGPIDVVTGDGRYVGTFLKDATEMPDAFGPNGMAAFIEHDDFDVARVVVRRLPAAVR